MTYLGLRLRLLLLGLFILVVICYARCDTTGRRKILSPANYVNPHTYQLGTTDEVYLAAPEKHKIWTVVVWRPAGTPLLYQETLLFCSDVTSKFENVRADDELVLIFSRAVEVARMDGPRPNIVACRNLEQVIQIRTKEQK